MSIVLIVDDYPDARKALRSLLEKQLLSVVCMEAGNGLEAIALTEISHPDLIILDLSMPKMNGLEAAVILQKSMPQVPLFLFTLHESREVQSQAASVGIRAVFSKSTGICALVEQVSALLNPSHALAKRSRLRT